MINVRIILESEHGKQREEKRTIKYVNISDLSQVISEFLDNYEKLALLNKTFQELKRSDHDLSNL
jgi:hypothetical protein